MNTRTTSSRNLWGGFLGGVLGIAASAIFELLLPVGCLLGVLLGFYYQEIVAMVAADFLKTIARWKAARIVTMDFLTGSRQRTKEICADLLKDWGDIGRFLGWTFLTARGTLGLLGRMVRWPNKHPMNGARLMTVAASITYGLINLFWIVPLGIWGWSQGNRLDTDAVMVVSLVILMPVTVISLVTIYDESEYSELEKMTAFYEAYQNYVTKGGVHYYAAALWKMFRVETGMLFYMITIIAIGAVCFAFALGFVVIPLVVSILAVNGLYKFAKMPSHWPCSFVTCATTVATVLIAPSHLAGTMLWVLALCNGTLCAFLSEILRRTLEGYFARSASARRWVEREGTDILEAPFVRCFWPAQQWFNLLHSPLRRLMA